MVGNIRCCFNVASQYRTRYQAAFEPILATMIYTGARMNEVAGLRLCNVVLAEALLTIPTPTEQRGVKNDEERQVPMAPPFAVMLRTVVQRRRLEGAASI